MRSVPEQGPLSTPVLGQLEGHQIGRYLIRQRLGGGGVATVYQAYDQVAGQTVALKVLPPNADEATLGRFRREAVMAGALHHPHIVRIYQVGTSSRGGAAYIAMELVEGESLASLLARVGQLRPEESCNLLEPVVRALAFAHQHGVVHRDVKPGNILLRPVSPGAPNSVQLEALDHPVTPLLSDFGVARFLDAPELTSTGRTVGTPAFMAPEQCAGSREIDGRADLYAVGTVLYRCVVGRLPFVGSMTQVLHAQVYDPIVIDARIMEELQPDVISLLRRSLAKAPEDRYATAAAMADDLARAAHRTANASARHPAEQQSATATLTLTTLVPVSVSVGKSDTKILVPGSRAVAEPPKRGRSRRMAGWTQAAGLLTAILLLVVIATLGAVLLLNAREAVSDPRDAARGLAILAPPPTATATSTLIAKPAGVASPGVEARASVVTELPDKPEPRARQVETQAPQSTDTPTPDPSPTFTAVPTSTALPVVAEPVAPVSQPAPAPIETIEMPEGVPLPTPTASLPSTPSGEVDGTDATAELVAGACANVVDQFFLEMPAAMDAAGWAEFTCPSAPAYSARAVSMLFEQGYMLRLDESPVIYVYYQATGEWEQVVAVVPSGEPANPPADTGDGIRPAEPFGSTWLENQRRLELGAPVTPEPEAFDAIVQVFRGGILVGSVGDGRLLAFPRSRLRL